MPATTPSRGRALIALLRPDARRWVGLGALVATGSLLLLTGPLVVRQIVDRATAGADSAELARLAVVFLAIAVVTQVVAVVVARRATIAAWRTTNDLRMRITRHVLGLDHEFHRRHTPGELIQRVDGDVTSVADFLGQVVPKAAGGVMLVGGVLVVLTVLDWRLGVGMAVYLAGAVAVVVAMRHRAVRESSDEMGAYAAALRRHRGAPHRRRGPAGQRGRRARDVAVRRGQSGTMQSSVRRERAFLSMWWAVQGSVAAGSVLTLVISATLVGSGVISLGTAFLLFQYVLLVSRPLEELVHELETVQKANGAMVRVIELLDVEPTIVDRRHDLSADGDRSPCGAAASASTTATSGRSSTTSTSTSPPAARSGSSGAPAAARRRSRGCCSAWSRRRAAPCRSVGCRSPTSRWPSCGVESRSSRRRSSCSKAPSGTT